MDRAVDLAMGRSSGIDIAADKAPLVDITIDNASVADLAKDRLSVFDIAMDRASKLGLAVDRKSNVDLAMDRASSVDLDKAFAVDLAMDGASSVDLDISSDVNLSMDRSSAVDLALDRAAAIIIHDIGCSSSPFPFDPENFIDVTFESLSDAEMCDVTGFTGAEKKMLWESWKEMAESDESRLLFSVRLISWMQKYIPIMPKLFIDGWVKEIGNDGVAKKFLQHAYSLIRELHMIVTLLPSPSEMMNIINALMGFHVNMRPMVGTKYFKPFHQHFSKFVSGHLAQPTDSHIVRLWVSLIGMFYRVMDDKEANMSVRSSEDTYSTGVPDSETKEKPSMKDNCNRKQFGCCCSVM